MSLDQDWISVSPSFSVVGIFCCIPFLLHVYLEVTVRSYHMFLTEYSIFSYRPLAKNSIVNYRKNTIVLSLQYTIVKLL